MVATIVSVGDWTADSEAHLGFTISDRGLSGLTDGVGVKRGEIPREGQHGSHDTPVFLDSRVVSVGGKCWARSPEDLHQYGVILRGLGATGDRFQVTFQHGGQTYWAWARRGSQPMFEEHPALGFADWQYDFWMPDPRLFGEVRRFDSTAGVNVAAHHRGNFPATPRFKVAGFSTGGYALYRVGGGTFKVAGNRSGTDEVDFNTGQVYRDGVLLTGAVATGDLWTVAGGASQEWRVDPLTAGQTGSANMFLPDTFV